MRQYYSKPNLKKLFLRKRVFILITFLITLIIFAGISWHKFFLAHSQWIPKDGGIFTDSVVGKINNISPLAPNKSLVDLDLQQLIFSGLLRHNPLTDTIDDGLATLRISEDGKTYFLTLKDSAKFSNGDKVTIEDVLFTFEEVIQNPNFDNKPLKKAFEYVSFDRIDKDTIAFKILEPNTYFSSLLTTPILQKKSYQNSLIEEINDPELPANKRPLSTGPYILKNIVHEERGLTRVFLERNPYFFAGKPFIKQFVFYIYSKFDYLKDDINWTTMYSRLFETEKNKISENLFDEYATREYLLPRFIGVFFNLDSKKMANPHLRKALLLSTDKKSLLKKEIGWKRIDSVFFFEGIESWQEANFAEARRLLRDKGFKYNKKEEIRFYKDQPVELKMITSTSPAVYSRIAQNMARTWERELDIKINLEVLNPAKFQEAVSNRDYDLVFFGQNFSRNRDILSVWHSSQSGKSNLANLTNPDIDYLIEEVLFSGTQSDLLTLNQKLEEIVPAIPIATPKYELLINRDLLGFSKTFGKIRQHAERFFGIEKWYFEQQRGWDWPKHQSKFAGFLSWLFNGKKEVKPDYRETIPPELLEKTDEKKDK